MICRGSNNYGPRQYPEKLIPLMVLNALHGDPLPVYGDGRQVRNWLFVEDFCRAIHPCCERGRARRGLQRRRAGRVREHRRRAAHARADRRRRVADRARDRPPRPRPPLLARRPTSSATSSAGSRRCASTRASSARSTGTATTRTGGGRSAPASTASTTSASTARAARASGPSLERGVPDDTARLELRGLTKRYDDGTLALEDFDLDDPGGLVLRPARPERRRQDHADQRGLQPDPGHRRRGARVRRAGRLAAGAQLGRARRAGHQPRPLPDRRGDAGLPRRLLRHDGRRGRARATR